MLGTHNWYQSLHLIIWRVKSLGSLKSKEQPCWVYLYSSLKQFSVIFGKFGWFSQFWGDLGLFLVSDSLLRSSRLVCPTVPVSLGNPIRHTLGIPILYRSRSYSGTRPYCARSRLSPIQPTLRKFFHQNFFVLTVGQKTSRKIIFSLQINTSRIKYRFHSNHV